MEINGLEVVSRWVTDEHGKKRTQMSNSCAVANLWAKYGPHVIISGILLVAIIILDVNRP